MHCVQEPLDREWAPFGSVAIEQQEALAFPSLLPSSDLLSSLHLFWLSHSSVLLYCLFFHLPFAFFFIYLLLQLQCPWYTKCIACLILKLILWGRYSNSFSKERSLREAFDLLKVMWRGVVIELRQISSASDVSLCWSTKLQLMWLRCYHATFCVTEADKSEVKFSLAPIHSNHSAARSIKRVSAVTLEWSKAEMTALPTHSVCLCMHTCCSNPHPYTNTLSAS